jgi:hypothetical protein
MSGDCLLNDVGQELHAALTASEGGPFDDLFQMPPKLRKVFSRFDDPCGPNIANARFESRSHGWMQKLNCTTLTTVSVNWPNEAAASLNFLSIWHCCINTKFGDQHTSSGMTNRGLTATGCGQKKVNATEPHGSLRCRP